MDKTGFAYEMKKLGTNFNIGKENLEGKMTFYYPLCKEIPDIIMTDVFNFLVFNSERFPTMREFRETIVKFSKDSKFNTLPKDVVYNCIKCESTGFVTLVKQYTVKNEKPVFAEYCFRCSCKNGANKNQRIPEIPPVSNFNGFMAKDQFEDRRVTA
jgi:hypothetical protein